MVLQHLGNAILIRNLLFPMYLFGHTLGMLYAL